MNRQDKVARAADVAAGAAKADEIALAARRGAGTTDVYYRTFYPALYCYEDQLRRKRGNMPQKQLAHKGKTKGIRHDKEH
ncbi:MAG: hypothetical protein NT011_01710 [Kiritimatiellaeota bacterium]|nr:hypothetical protein [Kiritimatiellota bacterium]